MKPKFKLGKLRCVRMPICRVNLMFNKMLCHGLPSAGFPCYFNIYCPVSSVGSPYLLKKYFRAQVQAFRVSLIYISTDSGYSKWHSSH